MATIAHQDNRDPQTADDATGSDVDTPNAERAHTENRSPAALRALAEAEARRAARKGERSPAAVREIGGRGGADPARFGDWEIDGRAIDF